VRQHLVVRAAETVGRFVEIRDFVFASGREPEFLFVRQNFVIGAAETVRRLQYGYI